MLSYKSLFLLALQLVLNISYFVQLIKYINPAIKFNKCKFKNRFLLNICFAMGVFSYFFYISILYTDLYDPVAYNTVFIANAFLYGVKSILDTQKSK